MRRDSRRYDYNTSELTLGLLIIEVGHNRRYASRMFLVLRMYNRFTSNKDQNVPVPEAGMPAVPRTADFLMIFVVMYAFALAKP